MKITICHWCLKVWEKRPFVCDCKSNVFMKDYEASDEELSKLKQDNKFKFMKEV